jgi:Fic family protein
VIQDGLTVKGKSLKDHLEAKNHHEAVQFLHDLVEHEKRRSVSENLIRSLQKLVIKDIEDEGAGQYRKANVLIMGSSHNPPDAFEIPQLMHEFISWINKNEKKLHPIQLAAQAHHKLVNIHPFTDGNGRTARLFMNILLMQRGFPMVIILKNDRKKYYNALEKAENGKLDDIEKFIAQAVERSLNIYIKAINSGTGVKDKLMKLSDLSKGTPYSIKYLNLLARTGKIDAHKDGRVWVASKKSLEEYIQNRERKR